MGKTEYMCIGQQYILILEDGERIKQCNEYKYLGARNSRDWMLGVAINVRNNLGRKSIDLLKGIL